MKLKTCAICRATFETNKSDQKACSKLCGARFSRGQAQRTRQSNSVLCQYPGCGRWILKRYGRQFCMEHMRKEGLEHTVPVPPSPTPRPIISRLVVLASAIPPACPKCGGFVGPQQGSLVSGLDSAYQESFYCLNCGATGHDKPANFPQHTVLSGVRAKVQHMALPLL